MTNQLQNTGEEYILDKVDGESHPVGLYNDGTDALADADDIGSVTTEPSGSNYGRQTAALSTSKNANGNWQVDVADVTFDTSDSDQSVDSGFVVVNFDSDDAGDGGTASDHLLFTFPIEDSDGNQTSLNLTNFNEFTLSGQSLSLD